jgi:MarR family transcriptional regulator, organic hydroperoxide resistance regulator
MSAHGLHSLIERIASVFRSNLREVASTHGLKLVQLEAMVYLANANRYSDTAGALAEYLGLTKGTVSQTLKTLEARGLVVKRADTEDARIVRCELTPAAVAIVQRAYPAPLLDGLDDGLTDEVTLALQRLLRSLQRANQMRTFGECRSCRFFQPRAQGGRCALTEEALSSVDMRRLCREHEPPERRAGRSGR